MNVFVQIVLRSAEFIKLVFKKKYYLYRGLLQNKYPFFDQIWCEHIFLQLKFRGSCCKIKFNDTMWPLMIQTKVAFHHCLKNFVAFVGIAE